MVNNIIEIRADKKDPADMRKCKLFHGETEIVNIQPQKLYNDHGRLVMKAEIHFVKAWLNEPEEKAETKKNAKKEDKAE